jgi:hypothetical protein
MARLLQAAGRGQCPSVVAAMGTDGSVGFRDVGGGRSVGAMVSFEAVAGAGLFLKTTQTALSVGETLFRLLRAYNSVPS